MDTYICAYTHTYTPCLQDCNKLIAGQGHKNGHTYVHAHIRSYTPCLQDRIKLIAGQGQ